MRVLVACEYSGTVRDAFLKKGHDAISCDILPTSAPGPHITGNVLDHLLDGWDILIAHPPCTFLANAGMANKKRDPSREIKTSSALKFVLNLWAAPINKVCIENPNGVLATRWRKPSQIIEPWYFGEPEKKMTCLWLRGLPKLQGKIDIARDKKAFEPLPHKIYPSGRKQYWSAKIGDRSPHPLRGHFKSKTFDVFANAMAEQWG